MPTAPAKPKMVGMWPLAAEHMLRGYLAPKVAMDAEIDLKPLVRSLSVPVKGKPFTIDRAKVKAAMDAMLAPGSNGKSKLAKDADVADVQELLSQLEELAPEIADLVVGGPEALIAGATPGEGVTGVPGEPEADPFAPEAEAAPAEVPGEPADPTEAKAKGEGDVPKGNPDAGIVHEDDRAEPTELQSKEGAADPPGDPAESKVEGDPADPDDATAPTEADPTEVPGEPATPVAKVLAYLQNVLSPEQMAEVEALVESEMATDNKGQVNGKTSLPPKSAADDKPTAVTHTAMDAAIKAASKLARDAAITETIARLRAIDEAKQAVLPHVGPISVAMDSAASVYRFALEKLGVANVKDIPDAALPHIIAQRPAPGARTIDPKLAADAATAATGLQTRFGTSLDRFKQSA